MSELEKQIQAARAREASEESAHAQRQADLRKANELLYPDFIDLMQRHGIAPRPLYSEAETTVVERRRLTTFGRKTDVTITTRTYVWTADYWPLSIDWHGARRSGISTLAKAVEAVRTPISRRAPTLSYGEIHEYRAVGDASFDEWDSCNKDIDVIVPGAERGFGAEFIAKAARSLIDVGAPLRGPSP